MSFLIESKAEEFYNKIIKSRRHVLFATKRDFTIVEVLIIITQITKEDISYLGIYYPVLYRPSISYI